MPILPIKITQITKDFDLKSKDVLDTFKEIGIEKKTGGSADADEFELFLSHLTLKNQIKDLDAYRSGRTKIHSSVEKKEKPAPAPKVEAKPEAKPEVKHEPKPEYRDNRQGQQGSFKNDNRQGQQGGYQAQPQQPAADEMQSEVTGF